MAGFFKGLLVGLASFGLGLGVLAVVLPPDLRVSIAPDAELILPPTTPDARAQRSEGGVAEASPEGAIQPIAEPATVSATESAIEVATEPVADAAIAPRPELTEALAPDLSGAPGPQEPAGTPQAGVDIAPEPALPASAQPSLVPEPAQDLAAVQPVAPVAQPSPQVTEAPRAPAEDSTAQIREFTPIEAGRADMPQEGSELAPELTQDATRDAVPASAPEAEPAMPPASAPLDIAALPDPIPDPTPDPAQTPAPQPEPRILRAVPTTLLDRQVEGVVTGRLPRIGAEPATGDLVEAPETTAELPALSRYGAAFDASSGLPRLSIILIDSPVAQDALIALPFALTIAVDPDAPEAATRAALYRAAGHEVALLATGLPTGATASDLAVTFGEWHRILPEAVALIDPPDGGGLTGDRLLAQAVMPYLLERGLGLITPDLGLNQAAQVAQAAGVPQASIFRRIDTGDEAEPLIRRFLTRAAFEAQTQGQVVVLGRAEHAPTLAALVGWRLEMRASQVALAPVSALLDPRARP